MSTEKQIEEMSNDLRVCHTEFSTGDEEIYTDYDATAQKLIAKGWSRQSEGEWRNLAKVGVYMCTACTQLSPQPYPYCPKCGAKMKGGEE